MATATSLQALVDTHKALQDIRSKVQPLLDTLHDDNDADEAATARAGVALTLGTLRFMAQRLKGTSRSTSDPLRAELNRMRRMLVQVQQRAAAKQQPTAAAKRKTREAQHETKIDNDEKKQNDDNDTKQDDDTKSPSTATPAAKRRRRR